MMHGLLASADRNQLLFSEAWALLKLGLPQALGSMAWVAMKTTDTALLGHEVRHNNEAEGGTDAGDNEPYYDESYYLKVCSYADLWMSFTGMFTQGQVMGILAGPCIESGQTKLVGIWLQVSLACLSVISLVSMICFACTKHVLLAFAGSNITISMANDAQYYANVLILALPSRVLIIQLKQYLACQKIIQPHCVASLVGVTTNIVLGLYFVLGIPYIPFLSDVIGIPYGFISCPWVTVFAEWLQPIVVWVMALRSVEGRKNILHTWPSDGWAKGRHVTKERCIKFFTLYWPAATMISSDFLCASILGLLVSAQQSPLSVVVFNSSYRIVWMCHIFNNALAAAVGIQVNLALGGGRAEDAKYSMCVGMTMSLVVIATFSLLVLLYPTELARIFSNDEAFLAIYQDARWTLMLTMVYSNLSVCLKRFVMSLGYTRYAFYASFLGTWGGQIPFAVLLTKMFEANMFWLYLGMSSGNCFTCIILLRFLWKCDWEEVLQMANDRSERKPNAPECEKPIMSS